jgi:hypothetical protein
MLQVLAFVFPSQRGMIAISLIDGSIKGFDSLLILALILETKAFVVPGFSITGIKLLSHIPHFGFRI